MDHIVLFATAWGTRFGGINALNRDLFRALALSTRGVVRVICVVCDAEPEHVRDAESCHVQLLNLVLGWSHDRLSPAWAPFVKAQLGAKFGDALATWWVGHDIISGEIALAMRDLCGGRVALVHHMDYKAYLSFKHGVGKTAIDKHREQQQLFAAADKVFAVGPLLRDSVIDMLGCSPRDVHMLIPGLADIKARELPRKFTAITFGRLNPENDRIKQSALAVAAFASAVSQANANEALPKGIRDAAQLKVIGINEPGGAEEQALRTLAHREANRVIELLPLPYEEERIKVFEELSRSTFAMMLSWHEGFGLTGWEAVAAEVPLIIGKRSGVYRLIEETIQDPGLVCVKAIDIRGQEDPGGEVNYRDEDLKGVAQAILEIAADPVRWKGNAKSLRARLADICTWENTAATFASVLELIIPPNLEMNEAPVNIRAHDEQPVTVSVAGNLFETRHPTWNAKLGLAPSHLLHPEEGCVPFHASRLNLVDEIVAWCCDNAAPSLTLQLRTGPGGSGKTRLMLKVCDALAKSGWVTGFVAGGLGNDLPILATALFSTTGNKLLVIDYGETRRDEIASLIRTALRVRGSGVIRILLIARRAGDWWTRLPEDYADIESFLTGAAVSGPYEIPSIPFDHVQREAIFAEALAAYASKLGRGFNDIKSVDLDETHFAQVLYIHMAALAVILNERPETASGLLEATIRREKRYWRAALSRVEPSHGNNLDIAQAMALFTLVGGTDSKRDTEKLLSLVPALRALPDSTLRQRTRILHDLYPKKNGIDAVQPDVVGERFAADECARDERLLAALFGAASSSAWREAALTRLTRLVQHDPSQASWVTHSISQYLAECATVVVKVAIETGDPAGMLYADALASASRGRQYQVASRLAPLLPWDTISLRELADQVAEIRLRHELDKRHTRTLEDDVRLADMYMDVAKRKRDLSKHEDALVHETAALAIIRRWRAKQPKRFGAKLANCLSHIGSLLHEMGRYEEALEHHMQAMEIQKVLLRDAPHEYRDDFAASTLNIGSHLSAMGRYEEAITHTQHALEICRDLAAEQPDTFDAYVALSLVNMSGYLSAVGRYEEALAHAQQGVKIYGEIAERRPDAFREQFANSMTGVGARLSEMGEYSDALNSTQMALRVLRQLTNLRPDVFGGSLAGSLNSMSQVLSELGRYDDALIHADEALSILEDLTKKRPDAYQDDLGYSLMNLSRRLRDVGRYEEALHRAQQALKLFEERAKHRPQAMRDKIAELLSETGDLLGDMGRYADAQEACSRAVAQLWSLAADRPSDSRREALAHALTQTAWLKMRTGSEFIGTLNEANQVWANAVATGRGSVTSPERAFTQAVEAELLMLTNSMEARTESQSACAIYAEMASLRPAVKRYREVYARYVYARCQCKVSAQPDADAGSAIEILTLLQGEIDRFDHPVPHWLSTIETDLRGITFSSSDTSA
jgi:tetratricopeptide (TPR) repeat protein/glycosyltransferase involved in cell wall biosynthesis